ncbi:MAG: glutathione S-transferase family protein [Pseudomonadota bacterium]
MADTILHHYPMSPFSELLRIALGHKGVAWKSVIIPNMAPKPDLIPLTGGYRKTPVLQIGADIYCDTAIAIEAIEAAHPVPSFFPAPMGRTGAFATMWASGPLFSPSVATAMAKIAGNLPPEFWADRKALFGFDPDRFTVLGPHLKSQFEATLARADDALDDGRAILGGADAGYADFALYINVWFQRLFNPQAPVLDPFPNVKLWADRVATIGHGTSTELSAQDALAIAKDATPAVVELVEAHTGFTAGQSVTVRTEDPGANPVAGKLVRLTSRDIAVLRDDPQVGTVAVHFPRLGQIVTPA